MSKLTLALVSIVVGVAVGVSVPSLLAQQASPPKVQKWEQYCERLEAVRVAKIDERLKAYGDRGFALVGVFGDDAYLYCYRRPVH